MKIHEYQARQLLVGYGIPVPDGIVVELADTAAAAFETLSKGKNDVFVVVKAQVHAGGRGKGGGVRLARSAEEVRQIAHAILSQPLVTPQTGPEGVPVKKLLIAVGVDIANEYYLGMTVDRSTGHPMLIASSEGGMEIEQVALHQPDKIVREPINPSTGMQPYQTRKIAYRLGFTGKQVAQAARIMIKLCQLFLETDASLAEINPLVVTPTSDEHPDGQVLAIDAKMNFDDNAMFRHKDLAALDDPDGRDPAEARAAEHGLSYVNLDGNIGCLVNGAGLAMATMDLIKLHGGEPANFLDVGGSATEQAITEGFRIIIEDQNVKGILVNIFGGIAKCDTIARAIVNVAGEMGFRVPLVVRLEGTNVDQARQILEQAQDKIPVMQIGSDLTDAAERITGAITV